MFVPPPQEEEKRHLMYMQSFSYMKVNANYYTDRKCFQSYLLLFTYEGEGILNYDGETYTLKAGDGFLIDCRKAHMYRTNGSAWVHSDLHFNGGPAEYFYHTCYAGDIPIFHYKATKDYQLILEDILMETASVSP